MNQNKTLDMADKYPPAEDFGREEFRWDHSKLSDAYDPYLDDEPTVKIQVPQFVPQIVVPMDSKYPGVGLIIAITTGLLFWGSLYYFFR